MPLIERLITPIWVIRLYNCLNICLFLDNQRNYGIINITYMASLLSNMADPPVRKKRQLLQDTGTLNPHAEQVTDALFQQSAFFDRQDLLQVKYEMLRCVEKEGRSVSQAASDFGFSRRHFYVIQRQFSERGFLGLLPEKRGPRSAHKLDATVMAFVRQALDEDPSLKAPALARRIQAQFQRQVHPRSIERALARKKKPRTA